MRRVRCLEGCRSFFADGEEVWDDVLSEAELNLICGVYLQFTGELLIPLTLTLLYTEETLAGYGTDTKNQTQDASWWPKTNSWRGSGLDAGYWTTQCEEWYQTRRAGIMANDAKTGALMTPSVWRNKMKYSRTHLQGENGILSANKLFAHQCVVGASVA